MTMAEYMAARERVEEKVKSRMAGVRLDARHRKTDPERDMVRAIVAGLQLNDLRLLLAGPPVSGDDVAGFATKLAVLTSSEASAAHSDAERMGVMIERLAAGLGFTIAVATRGDARAIDEMLAGAEAYAHAEAVDKSRLARFMADMRGAK